MASNKAMIPQPEAEPLEGFELAASRMETRIQGVQGSVGKTIIDRLRRMVEKDTEAFARGMRGLINEGRSDE